MAAGAGAEECELCEGEEPSGLLSVGVAGLRVACGVSPLPLRGRLPSAAAASEAPAAVDADALGAGQEALRALERLWKKKRLFVAAMARMLSRGSHERWSIFLPQSSLLILSTLTLTVPASPLAPIPTAPSLTLVCGVIVFPAFGVLPAFAVGAGVVGVACVG